MFCYVYVELCRPLISCKRGCCLLILLTLVACFYLCSCLLVMQFHCESCHAIHILFNSTVLIAKTHHLEQMASVEEMLALRLQCARNKPARINREAKASASFTAVCGKNNMEGIKGRWAAKRDRSRNTKLSMFKLQSKFFY